MPSTLYRNLRDDQKVEKNWIKTLGLYRRGEHSVVVIRCGTCLELATNFAIRQELDEYGLPKEVVDMMLIQANGIQNKYNKLYLPLIERWDHHQEHKKLWKKIDQLNKVRNRIVHGGEFKNRATATNAVKDTHAALEKLLQYCETDAVLRPPPDL